MTIYLDNNATTAIDPRVAAALADAFQGGPANPSSQHALGQAARVQMERAQEVIGIALGSRFDQPGGPRLILTSGGTESNNLAIRGIGEGTLIISKIEHPSVLGPAQSIAATGRSVRWLDCEPSGMISVEALHATLSEEQHVGLVSVMSANHETGVLQPVAEIAEICRRFRVPFHIDATQSIGKTPIQLDELGAAAVTFTAHKLHGPVGVGALWLNSGVTLQPLLHGGSQQLDSRPGTEAVALAIGFSEAIRLACQELPEAAARMAILRDRLENQLLEQFPELVVHGRSHPRLPNTSFVSLVGVNRQSMLMALDLAGVACSSGSACTSGSSPPSHVLQAMGVTEELLDSAIRFGVSKFSTDEEINRAIDSISLVYNRLRQFS